MIAGDSCQANAIRDCDVQNVKDLKDGAIDACQSLRILEACIEDIPCANHTYTGFGMMVKHLYTTYEANDACDEFVIFDKV